ncbi:TRAP transporter small permease [Paracoccus sp. (in: a-proteobacteria)]|uniref:TRAP transporter small permease n=1 Tax=Paracoccus sp. TaxID=267 RepID=UPI0035B32AAE
MSAGDHAAPDAEGPARPLLRGFAGIKTALDWSGRIIAVACLAFMFVALLTSVILRYAFGSGIPWAYEIHAILLPWLVAGGIVIAAAQGRNIAITLLTDLVSPDMQRWIMVAVNIAVLVICVAVLWTSQPILKASQFQKLSTLGIKQVWGYASLIFAFGAMAVIALIDALQGILGANLAGHDPTHASLS